jgi:hypothetical protein
MNPVVKGFGLGLLAGLATATVLPVLVPAFAEAGRPLAKALLKHTLLGLERLKVSVARAAEATEDFLAEVRAEVELELSKRETASDAPAVTPQRASAAEAVHGEKVYS